MAEHTSTSIVAMSVPVDVEDATEAVLHDLHAVLYTQDGQVFLYHASFPDFILLKHDQSSTSITRSSCSLAIKPTSDNAVVLSEQVNQNISAVLRYSSHYWTCSSQLIYTDNLLCCISEFLQICVLFWIEVMNLLGLCNL